LHSQISESNGRPILIHAVMTQEAPDHYYLFA